MRIETSDVVIAHPNNVSLRLSATILLTANDGSCGIAAIQVNISRQMESVGRGLRESSQVESEW